MNVLSKDTTSILPECCQEVQSTKKINFSYAKMQFLIT